MRSRPAFLSIALLLAAATSACGGASTDAFGESGVGGAGGAEPGDPSAAGQGGSAASGDGGSGQGGGPSGSGPSGSGPSGSGPSGSGPSGSGQGSGPSGSGPSGSGAGDAASSAEATSSGAGGASTTSASAGAGGASTTGSGGGAGCMAITLTDLNWDVDDFAYGSRISPNLDGASTDELEILFYDDDYAGDPVSPPGSEPGTYDLSAETSFFDCGRCLLGFVDGTDSNDAQRVFFQSSGTLTLDEGSEVLEGIASFSVSNVVLVEAEIDFTDGTTTFVPDGACLYLASGVYEGL